MLSWSDALKRNGSSLTTAIAERSEDRQRASPARGRHGHLEADAVALEDALERRAAEGQACVPVGSWIVAGSLSIDLSFRLDRLKFGAGDSVAAVAISVRSRLRDATFTLFDDVVSGLSGPVDVVVRVDEDGRAPPDLAGNRLSS